MPPSSPAAELLPQLRAQLRTLHRLRGEPSTREIARRTGRAISHSTVNLVLRCEKRPRWEHLEVVVRALDGNVGEFRSLWLDLRNAEDQLIAQADASERDRVTADVIKSPAVGAQESGESPEGNARREFRNMRAMQRADSNLPYANSTSDGGNAIESVRCPICLTEFNWSESRLTVYAYSEDQWGFVKISRRNGESEPHWRQRAAGGYVRCPSEWPRGEHYLPALYGAYGQPVIIPVVGGTNSGKTTLLTMIGAELERNPVLKDEVSFHSLNRELGNMFRERALKPLLEERRVFSATNLGSGDDFFHAWRGYNHRTGRPFVLAFFDVAGEQFHEDPPSFVDAASGFIFLVDPDRLAKSGVDETFIRVMGEYIRSTSGESTHRIGLPAAVVVAKSDLLHHSSEVSRWLNRDDEAKLRSIEFESEDVYAFLKTHQAEWSLLPVWRFSHSTLHFLSATGVGVEPNTLCFYEENFGPRRVLRPLLSLLKSVGVVELSQFEE